MCKKDDRSSHQNSIKFHIFISTKGAGFGQEKPKFYIYLTLELLYHKRVTPLLRLL